MPSSKFTYDQQSGAPSSVVKEEQIEYGFIGKLQNLKYEYRADIRDRASLERNFREKFEALNRVHLTDGEFARLLDEIVTPDVFAAVFEDGELDSAATVKESLTVQTEGSREVQRTLTLYNLDAILAVGYRVRSPRGVQFRRWASSVSGGSPGRRGAQAAMSSAWVLVWCGCRAQCGQQFCQLPCRLAGGEP